MILETARNERTTELEYQQTDWPEKDKERSSTIFTKRHMNIDCTVNNLQD